VRDDDDDDEKGIHIWQKIMGVYYEDEDWFFLFIQLIKKSTAMTAADRQFGFGLVS